MRRGEPRRAGGGALGADLRFGAGHDLASCRLGLQSRPRLSRTAEAGPSGPCEPYRSLGSTGFFILMSAVGIVSFVTGLVFLMLGAWPVMGSSVSSLLVYVLSS